MSASVNPIAARGVAILFSNPALARGAVGIATTGGLASIPAVVEPITATPRTVQTAGGLQTFPTGRAHEFPTEHENKAGDKQTDHHENRYWNCEDIQYVDSQECSASEQGSHEQPDSKPPAASIAFRVWLEHMQVVSAVLGPVLLRKR